MSFLSNVFKGATNDFTPGRAFGPNDKTQMSNFNAAQSQGQADYSHAQGGFDALTAALQQQMNGGGPNLANQNLQNFTGQNIANQAALMGGQRGASSNVGLMARQIGQQGANIQQQAAGQSASNVLQQQLAAQQQLGGALSSQGQLANQYYGTAVNGQNAQNANIMGDIQGANRIGSEQAGQNASMNRGIMGGLGNVAGSLAGLGGGKEKFFAQGGQVQQPQQPLPPSWQQNFLSGLKPPVNAQMMAQGGLPFAPHDYRQGGEVKASNPKQKAIKSGNSLANDKIPAMLSEQEVVLPREVTQSPNAPQAAAQFMAQVMAGKHRVKR